jgi:hypothetical protein
MMGAAESKVFRVGAAHCTVGEFGSWVRENGIPPLEKAGRVTFGGNRVVTCTMTCRDYDEKLATLKKKTQRINQEKRTQPEFLSRKGELQRDWRYM